MQGLETAMAFIQKGFFYNNDGMVKQGIKEFKDKLRDVDSFIIDIDEKEKVGNFHPRDYARTEIKSIKKLADEIGKKFKTGTKDESVALYNKMIKRCLACHTIIRKW